MASIIIAIMVVASIAAAMSIWFFFKTYEKPKQTHDIQVEQSYGFYGK